MLFVTYGIGFKNKYIVELFSRSIAFIAIIIFSPISIIISLILLIFQGRPIFYKHSRIGSNFIEFNLFKFRTMIKNEGDSITDYNDHRITRIGFFLRKFKIDEIPQLLNILNGEMRFIGPRPEVPEYCNKKDFRFLKMIKPGISDFASILFRNEDEYLRKIGGQNPYIILLEIKTYLL